MDSINLRQLRRTARLTQLELAQRCGLSRMRLSLAECGYVELSVAEQERIVNALLGSTVHRAADLTLGAGKKLGVRQAILLGQGKLLVLRAARVMSDSALKAEAHSVASRLSSLIRLLTERQSFAEDER